MAETPQTYANHTRRHPPFHFFMVPLLLINFIYAAVQTYRFRDLDHAWLLVLAIALIVLNFLTRINALRVQDRVIRLEERLRYGLVLPAALASRAVSLPTRLIVSLR
ncbi:MAG: hypothetical protein H7Z38_12815, partial [Rubrivivax sp.]|nr:hypothetical protein [Pyrinomonadaceae bacterium]